MNKKPLENWDVVFVDSKVSGTESENISKHSQSLKKTQTHEGELLLKMRNEISYLYLEVSQVQQQISHLRKKNKSPAEFNSHMQELEIRVGQLKKAYETL
ncbi:hypothetical protein Pmani_013347 [Petrolisthes manimaculis]|uniref:Uncharacterized protein n=1 Tax=Petrolisthes manimaculis TaxID=1843537 RepID=A0AAE1PXG0_9EUCA|nr:hypothetical protein Pmani_013347 [Petrolisthes manimaculis]